MLAVNFRFVSLHTNNEQTLEGNWLSSDNFCFHFLLARMFSSSQSPCHSFCSLWERHNKSPVQARQGACSSLGCPGGLRRSTKSCGHGPLSQQVCGKRTQRTGSESERERAARKSLSTRNVWLINVRVVSCGWVGITDGTSVRWRSVGDHEWSRCCNPFPGTMMMNSVVVVTLSLPENLVYNFLPWISLRLASVARIVLNFASLENARKVVS